jgi:hypothetical protein
LVQLLIFNEDQEGHFMNVDDHISNQPKDSTSQVDVTCEGLGHLLELARRAGTVFNWCAIALEWAAKADAEVRRLRLFAEQFSWRPVNYDTPRREFILMQWPNQNDDRQLLVGECSWNDINREWQWIGSPDMRVEPIGWMPLPKPSPSL